MEAKYRRIDKLVDIFDGVEISGGLIWIQHFLFISHKERTQQFIIVFIEKLTLKYSTVVHIHQNFLIFLHAVCILDGYVFLVTGIVDEVLPNVLNNLLFPQGQYLLHLGQGTRLPKLTDLFLFDIKTM